MLALKSPKKECPNVERKGIQYKLERIIELERIQLKFRKMQHTCFQSHLADGGYLIKLIALRVLDFPNIELQPVCLTNSKIWQNFFFILVEKPNMNSKVKVRQKVFYKLFTVHNFD